MNYNFSEAALHALRDAEKTAYQMYNTYIETENIFLGLASYQEGVAGKILSNLGFNKEMFEEIFDTFYHPEQFKVKRGKEDLTFSKKAEEVLEGASVHARGIGTKEVGTECILLALVSERTIVVEVALGLMGIKREQLLEAIYQALGFNALEIKKILLDSQRIQETEPKESVLDQYGRNLTEMAEMGKLDPVVGREEEILHIMQILSRRVKNNACLVGEPGVGKTAVVEALAQAIQEARVPEGLIGKVIYGLEMSTLLAGTKFRGEFEKRIRAIIDEVEERGNVILFIDELHSIIGAGGMEGTGDASNILKPALSRGEIQVIGATTINEYRKYIEKDAALARRFQTVKVEEPSREETLQILHGIAAKYEKFHNVQITDEAITSAVDLSIRYINDRFLPDKAIDLIDEASARKKIQPYIGKKPQKSDEALEYELKNQIEDELSRGMILEAKKTNEKLKRLTKKMLRDQEKPGFDLEITGDDVANVVSAWSGVPVNRMKQKEADKLLKLEQNLHKRIVGQEEAVNAVSRAIRRGRVGMKDPKRPIGSFLFLGPTGVGKTELSKALADLLFGDEKNLIRIDMSEYMEKHSVSKLIGSPPGYVGYDEGGQLSEMVRKNPYSVVLFDEIEKAHPDVFNTLLQVLDDGLLTDAQGRNIDFKNTIIIMTSNLGANRIVDPKTLGFVPEEKTDIQKFEEMKSGVMEEVKQFFRPEFLNRLDEMIVFKALAKEEVKDIASLLLNEVKKRALAASSIELRFTPKVKEFIFEKGYDEKFGARPLKRVIQTEIEDLLAEKMLSGEFKEGDKVTLSVAEKRVTFSKNLHRKK